MTTILITGATAGIGLQCATRIAYLAADPGLAGVTGEYFEDNRIRQPSAVALDDAVAARLRQGCDQLVGLAPAG